MILAKVHVEGGPSSSEKIQYCNLGVTSLEIYLAFMSLWREIITLG